MASKDKHCPHCGHGVASRTYRRHKQLFCVNGIWNTPSDNDTDSDQSMPETYDVSDMEETQQEVSGEDAAASDQESIDVPQPVVDAISVEALMRSSEICDEELITELEDDLDLNTNGDDLPTENDAYDDEDSLPGSLRASVLTTWFTAIIAHWMYVHNIPNNAVQYLLQFICAFLTVLVKFCPALYFLVKIMPNTFYKFRKACNTLKHSFVKYVVCTKCNKIRLYKDCFSTNGKAINCDFVKYPNHRMRTMRNPCGNPLLKEMRSKNKTLYYPKSVYCFNSLIAALKEMVLRPNYLKLCNQWRSRKYVPGTYRDVYDGRVWRELIDQNKFLQSTGDLCFILNLDWFQPFENSCYSTGVIYLANLNLSVNIRYKRDNVIVLAILPGPTEPNSSQLLCYMKPIVDELLELWQPGVECTNADGQTVRIRGMVISVSSDLPAARKLTGFYFLYIFFCLPIYVSFHHEFDSYCAQYKLSAEKETFDRYM